MLWPRSAVTGSCLLLGSSISVRLDLGTTRPGADRSSEYLGGRKAASCPRLRQARSAGACPGTHTASLARAAPRASPGLCFS